MEVEKRLAESRDWKKWIETSAEICRLPAADDRPGLCLTDPFWGTVSSTVIAVPDDLHQVCYRSAHGAPDTTEYDDYSDQAIKLLTQDSAGDREESAEPLTPAHRMRLNGPWQYEWGAGAESGRVKLPSDWETLFGRRAGTVRFRRRFGRPTNLRVLDRVYVAFERIGGTARISVNGTPLGTVNGATQTVRFGMTKLLRESNQLEVELTFDPSRSPGIKGGLWAPIAIEIFSITNAQQLRLLDGT
jgi:hypothetical protein